ncbi:ABC transporter ATP-binding protein [Gordonia crocea]|uniref:ABC transporter ATP-binding protein n=1 Tax=Gordonia crocea TaxID=589162 RepID=A0A7I9UUY3_9ACTN|nr:ABC transporter ATP-binding protein [Gordonia crocea]GED97014.1 ABC transporter ATP-binding protein [Gordonia crocea]
MLTTLLALLPPNSRGSVLRFTATSILSVIARAAAVVILVPLITALVDGEHGAAVRWLGALTAATVIGWVADWYTAKIGFTLGFGTLHHAQRDVSNRLSRIRFTWFGPDTTTDARQAVAATGPDLVGVIVYLVVPVTGAILLPVAIALALFGVAWQLGVVALIGVPLLLGALWGTGAISQRADRAANEANANLSERVVEFARTQSALRVARRVEPERSLAGDAIDRQHSAIMKLLLMQIPGQVLFSLASQIALFTLAGTAAWLMVNDTISPAQAVALLVVVVRYLEPFTILGELAGGLEATRLTLRRIGRVLGAPTVGAGEVATVPQQAPRIEFRGVSFDYDDPEHPVLDGLDLTLEPGTATAIIGPSGSGKSTILSLIAGLHEPTAGQILIDGVDAAAFDLPTRRALTSVVFQEPYLMGGTIEQNIAAGDPTAPPARLTRAAALARVDEITDRLPDGAAAQVGEGGSVLSGGERQRISIARALVKPAPILLIDEATSALDNENERAIVDALSADDRPRTRVIVAHRRAGIRRADRVVVVDRGRVVETGTPDELLERDGVFAQFWAHQDAGAGWKLTEVV